MKLAIISDIHGNCHALEAVLKDISDQEADEIICLGDLATIGPQPGEVIRKIQAAEINSIMGNHDLALLEPGKAAEYQIAPPLIPSLHWCLDRLDESDLTYIRDFKPYIKLEFNSSNNILCFHGSPLSSTDILTTETPQKLLDNFFSGCDENILIGGHTHYQLLRQYDEKIILNPGSVGTPFKGEIAPNSEPAINPWAEYAIIEITKTGLSINLRQLKYDIESYLKVLQGSDLPVKDWWISQLCSPGN